VTFSGLDLLLNANSYSYVGETPITIVLTDMNLTSTEYTTTIKVKNDPPEYSSAPDYSAKTVHLGSLINFVIPSFYDPENFHAVTCTITDSHAVKIISGTVNSGLVSITPTDFGMVGTHTLTIRLYDGNVYNTPNTMTVEIKNDAPIFTVASLS